MSNAPEPVTVASNAQEAEFATFGFISKKLRAGLLIGLLSLSLTANVFLVKFIIGMQGELYEKMLNRVDTQVEQKVDAKLDQPIKEISSALDRVDTSIIVADSASRKILTKNRK